MLYLDSSSKTHNVGPDQNGGKFKLSRLSCGSLSHRPVPKLSAVLNDKTAKSIFHRSWELQEGKDEVVAFGPSNKELQTTPRARIAKLVAASAEVWSLYLSEFIFDNRCPSGKSYSQWPQGHSE